MGNDLERRAIDKSKILLHPDRVAEWLRTGDCFPVQAEFGPTNRCNHRCVFCALDFIDRGPADINSGVALRAINEMYSMGVKSIVFAGEGEPILHRDTPEFIRTARDLGMETALMTNGVFFTPDKAERCLPYLTWMRFSIDAGTPENHARVHGTSEKDFPKIISNLRAAAEIKRREGYDVNISVQGLLIPDSLPELVQLADLAKTAGADNIQIKPYSQHPLSCNRCELDYHGMDATTLRRNLMSVQTDRFRVAFRDESIDRITHARGYTECHGLSAFALITARGEVIPCNIFYGNPDYVYGNINDQSLPDIWTGERRREVIQKINDTGLVACRKGCRLDATNKDMERVRHPEKYDAFL